VLHERGLLCLHVGYYKTERYFLSQLHCFRNRGSKPATAEIFTPWKLTNAAEQGWTLLCWLSRLKKRMKEMFRPKLKSVLCWWPRCHEWHINLRTCSCNSQKINLLVTFLSTCNPPCALSFYFHLAHSCEWKFQPVHEGIHSFINCNSLVTRV
jgi:hypothetical protein